MRRDVRRVTLGASVCLGLGCWRPIGLAREAGDALGARSGRSSILPKRRHSLLASREQPTSSRLGSRRLGLKLATKLANQISSRVHLFATNSKGAQILIATVCTLQRLRATAFGIGFLSHALTWKRQHYFECALRSLPSLDSQSRSIELPYVCNCKSNTHTHTTNEPHIRSATVCELHRNSLNLIHGIWLHFYEIVSNFELATSLLASDVMHKLGSNIANKRQVQFGPFNWLLIRTKLLNQSFVLALATADVRSSLLWNRIVTRVSASCSRASS